MGGSQAVFPAEKARRLHSEYLLCPGSGTKAALAQLHLCGLMWESGSKPERKGWQGGVEEKGAVLQPEACDGSCPAQFAGHPLLLCLRLCLLLSSFHGLLRLLYVSVSPSKPSLCIPLVSLPPRLPTTHNPPSPMAYSLSPSPSLSPFHLLGRLYFTSLSP